jgi:hypothetical protein
LSAFESSQSSYKQYQRLTCRGIGLSEAESRSVLDERALVSWGQSQALAGMAVLAGFDTTIIETAPHLRR